MSEEMKNNEAVELNDEELDTVAGGTVPFEIYKTWSQAKCDAAEKLSQQYREIDHKPCFLDDGVGYNGEMDNFVG